MAYLGYFIVASLPFGIYSVEAPGEISLTPINLFVYLFFPIIILNAIRSNKLINLNLVTWLHGLFVVMSFVGVVFAIMDRWTALRGSLAYFLEYFLVYLIVFETLRTRKELETALKILLVVTFMNCVMGWVELLGFMFFDEMIMPPFASYFKDLSFKNFGYGTGVLGIPGYVKMFGFLGPGADNLGSFTLFGLGAAFYFKDLTKKFIYKFFSVFFILTIIAGISRNAFVGLITMGLIYSIFKVSGRLVLIKTTIKFGIIAFIFTVILGVFYFTQNYEKFQDSSVQLGHNREVQGYFHLVQRLNPFVSKSFVSSQEFFTSHASLAFKYGFYNLGFGLGSQNFDEYVFENYPINFGSHSNFIGILGDQGVWGILVQMVIIFVVSSYAYKASVPNKNSNNNGKDLLAVALLASFVGIIITGLIRTYYLTPYTFVLQAMIVRLYMIRMDSN